MFSTSVLLLPLFAALLATCHASQICPSAPVSYQTVLAADSRHHLLELSLPASCACGSSDESDYKFIRAVMRLQDGANGAALNCTNRKYNITLGASGADVIDLDILTSGFVCTEATTVTVQAFYHRSADGVMCEDATSHKRAGTPTVEFFDDFASGTRASPSSSWQIITGTSVPGGPANFGTGEREICVSDTDHVWIDGNLHIKGTRGSDGNWYAGRMESRRQDFQPAWGSMMRVEARLNLPTGGPGIWPAFWLLGEGFRTTKAWPSIGEIDILESVNCNGVVYGTMHGGSYAGGPPFNEPSGFGGTLSVGSSIHGNWHIYAIEWDRSTAVEELRWYFDSTHYFTIRATDVPSDQWSAATAHGFYIIINLAIGGGFPDALAGGVTPNAATNPTAEYTIDYVKVTSTAGLKTVAPPATTPPPPTTTKATTPAPTTPPPPAPTTTKATTPAPTTTKATTPAPTTTKASTPAPTTTKPATTTTKPAVTVFNTNQDIINTLPPTTTTTSAAPTTPPATSVSPQPSTASSVPTVTTSHPNPVITTCISYQDSTGSNGASLVLELEIDGCMAASDRAALLRHLERAAGLCPFELYEFAYNGTKCTKRQQTTSLLLVGSQAEDQSQSLESAQSAVGTSDSTLAFPSVSAGKVTTTSSSKSKRPAWIYAMIAIAVLVGVAVLALVVVGIVWFMKSKRPAPTESRAELVIHL